MSITTTTTTTSITRMTSRMNRILPHAGRKSQDIQTSHPQSQGSRQRPSHDQARDQHDHPPAPQQSEQQGNQHHATPNRSPILTHRTSTRSHRALLAALSTTLRAQSSD